MSLLLYISYLAVAAALCFVILSLASGLLYVSELVEEHSKAAKYYGQRGIYLIIGLHIALYFTESLPFLFTLFSIACHVVYLQNFSHTWPLISLTSPTFMSSCVLVIADHFVWFFHFSHQATSHHEQLRRYGEYGARSVTPRLGFKEIASFFGICVWLAPLFLFLSLSANDNALPTAGSGDLSATAQPSGTVPRLPQTSQVSLFRSIVSALPCLRSRKGEGIIAPHSPGPHTPIERFPASPQSVSAYADILSPPHSQAVDFDRQQSQTSPIRLGKPPSRASIVRGPERVGLGARKVSPSISNAFRD